MSVFVRAYVSMQGVWPCPLVALTLPTGSGLGQRIPHMLGHDQLALPSVLCRVPWSGMGGHLHPTLLLLLPERCCGSVASSRGSCTCSWNMSGFAPVVAGAAGAGCMSARECGVYLGMRGWPVLVRCFTHLRRSL